MEKDMHDEDAPAMRGGANPQTFWVDAWTAWLGLWGARPPASPPTSLSSGEMTAKSRDRRFRGCIGPADLDALKDQDGES